MSWRPEGWKNPYPILPTDKTEWDAFEIGANVMLEALRKSAGIELDRPDIPPQYYKKGESEEIWFQAPADGYLVFIPDEVQEKISEEKS